MIMEIIVMWIARLLLKLCLLCYDKRNGIQLLKVLYFLIERICSSHIFDRKMNN